MKKKQIYRQLRPLVRQLKRQEKGIRKLDKQLEEARFAQKFIGKVTQTTAGVFINMDPMKGKRADGVWVVTEIKGNDVTLSNFFWLLNGDDVTRKQMQIPNLLLAAKGGDIVLELGALLGVSQKDVNGKLGFHMANIGPKDGTTQLQYDYVLGKLGLKEPIILSTNLRTVDGQFRMDVKEKGREKKNG